MAASRFFSQQMMHVWSTTGCGCGGGDGGEGSTASCEPYPVSADDSCLASDASEALVVAAVAEEVEAVAGAEDASLGTRERRMASVIPARSRRRRFLRRGGPTTQAGRVLQHLSQRERRALLE